MNKTTKIIRNFILAVVFVFWVILCLGIVFKVNMHYNNIDKENCIDNVEKINKKISRATKKKDSLISILDNFDTKYTEYKLV